MLGLSNFSISLLSLPGVPLGHHSLKNAVDRGSLRFIVELTFFPDIQVDGQGVHLISSKSVTMPSILFHSASVSGIFALSMKSFSPDKPPPPFLLHPPHLSPGITYPRRLPGHPQAG